MASGKTMTQPHDFRGHTMKGDRLAVQGLGITPRPTTPAHDLLLPSGVVANPTPEVSSSRDSAASDDGSLEDGEAYTMLQGVRSMNKVLEGQVEALRLRLQVEEKKHGEDKGKLTKAKDEIISSKETEIEDLKDSLVNREERIQVLVRASEEKDRIIETKVGEIDELKKLVKQTEDYANKLHRQIGRIRDEKKVLEGDTLYQEQNREISRLSEELALLKTRLAEMEIELKRALKIIEEQNSKIREMDLERGTVHDKFRQELEKATKAMRQEVERMREVMRQNYEEMRNIRDQNNQMHSDVKDIKELLLRSKLTPRNEGTGVQQPLPANPINMLQPAEYSTRSPAPPKRVPSKIPSQGIVRQSRAGKGSFNSAVKESVEHLISPSKDRALAKGHPPLGYQSPKPTASSSTKGGAQGSLPPICSMKDEPASLSPPGNSGQQRAKSGFKLATNRNSEKK